MYGNMCNLSIVGYIRPELPFEGLDKLVEAIKNDIGVAEAKCVREDVVNCAEIHWCLSVEGKAEEAEAEVVDLIE